MFVIFDNNEQRIPIKVWLPSREHLDEECLRQAQNLSNLPFAFKHIALMPDTHTGYGMPIGGVLASQERSFPTPWGWTLGAAWFLPTPRSRLNCCGK